MPEYRNSLLPERPEPPVWVVLRRAAPAIIAIGAVGVVVGILAGQPVAIIALDAVVILVGAVLRLIVRWR